MNNNNTVGNITKKGITLPFYISFFAITNEQPSLQVSTLEHTSKYKLKKKHIKCKHILNIYYKSTIRHVNMYNILYRKALMKITNIDKITYMHNNK